MLAAFRLVAACLALAPAVGHTQGALVGFLPSRDPPPAREQARLERVARGLGLVPADGQRLPLGGMVERAQALAGSARLDEAAALLDVALDEGTRAPLRLADPPALVRAALTRAAIGLARGEQDRADRLLALLLRFDPTFRLAPAEESPRMRVALERVRRRLGAAPALTREELGEGCESARLLVARRLDAGHVEYARFTGCAETARVRAGADDSDGSLILALGGPPAPPPAPAAVAAPAPAATTADGSRGRPVWRKGWFWGVTLGAVALVGAGVGVGVWAATRGGGNGGNGNEASWNVVPHF